MVILIYLEEIKIRFENFNRVFFSNYLKDVYSYGMVLYTIFSGKIPFDGYSIEEAN